MTEDLTRTTVSGLKWTYGSIAISVVLQLGYTAIMGRLLTPADFGLIAMAQVFLRFGSYFAEMGVGPALVQKPRLSAREVRASFTSSLLLGLLFAGAVFLAAPLGARLFEESDVVVVIRALTLTFVLNGAGLTALNLLRRDLRFRATAFVQALSYVIGYLGVGVTLALGGAGVWSLVAAALGQALLQSLFAYAASRHAVRPLVAWREVRGLYGFGGRVTVISFLEFLGGTLDVLAVGRYAGQRALGQYNRASLLVVLPFGHLTTGLSKVLFPTFSRIQEERDRVRRGYLGAVRLSSALLLPTAAGMAVAAHELVRVVLGDQWDRAADVLPVLAAAAALGFLSHFGGIVCEALGVLNPKLVLQAVFVALFAGLLFAARGGPLTAYALALLVAELVRHVLYMRLVGRVLDLPLRRQLVTYLPAAATAVLVAAAVAAVALAMRSAGLPLPVVLLGEIAAGASVLVLALSWGPLAGMRHELRTRLAQAGLLAPTTMRGRLLDVLLSFGRPLPDGRAVDLDPSAPDARPRRGRSR